MTMLSSITTQYRPLPVWPLEVPKGLPTTLSPPEATTAVAVVSPVDLAAPVVTVPLEPTVDCRVMVKEGTLSVLRLPFTTVTTEDAAPLLVVLLPQGTVSVIVIRLLEPWMVEVTMLVSVSTIVLVVEELPAVGRLVVMVTKTVVVAATAEPQTDEVVESASSRDVAVFTPSPAEEGVEMVAMGDMETTTTSVVPSTAVDEETGSGGTTATDMTLSTDSGVELGLP